MSQACGTRASPRGGARGCGAQWRQGRRPVAVAGAVVAIAALGAASAAAAQPPGDAAANLAGDGRLEAALALLDTWLADHPGDPRMFPVLLKVVTAAPRQPTVDAVVERYRGHLASDQIAVLRAAPADLAELSGGVVQALQALELPGIPDASERRAALLVELGEVTLDTAPEGMPSVHAGLARSGEGLGQAGLEPSLRAAFHGSGTRGDGGAAGAVAGYGLVSLLAANGRTDEAAAVLQQMGRRYPRSPEYALAAAELNAGAGLPRVVAFPSPAMLLGSLVATCLAPCPPPAAVLLAGPAERGETPTAPVAVPPAAVAPPVAPPITRLMVAPEVAPGGGSDSASHQAGHRGGCARDPAGGGRNGAGGEVRGGGSGAGPGAGARGDRGDAAGEGHGGGSDAGARAGASRGDARADPGREAGRGGHVVPPRRHRGHAAAGTGSSGRDSRRVPQADAGPGGGRGRRGRRAGAGLVAAHAGADRRRGKHPGNDLHAPLGLAGSVRRGPFAGHQGSGPGTARRDSGQPPGAGLLAAGSGGVHRSDRSLPRSGLRPGTGARAHRGRVHGGGALLPPSPTAASCIGWPWAAT